MKKNDIVRSQLRIPPDLYEDLKEAAAASKRSLNAEIVARLEQSVSIDELKQKDDQIQMLESFMKETLKLFEKQKPGFLDSNERLKKFAFDDDEE